MLGDALRGRGAASEAAALFDGFLVREGPSAHAYLNLGVALHEMGRLDDARSAYGAAAQAAADVLPSLPDQLGLSSSSGSSSGSSSSSSSSPVELNSSDNEDEESRGLRQHFRTALSNSAVVLHEQGALLQAIAAYESLIE